jgi:hypothetical protein
VRVFFLFFGAFPRERAEEEERRPSSNLLPQAGEGFVAGQESDGAKRQKTGVEKSR